ncbi:39S ribosomal protein L21, mitochondrial [Echinococcus granulosus]|nr:39S ribosomal protein L21, mitochondrial [Echinococcus granulosus]
MAMYSRCGLLFKSGFLSLVKAGQSQSFLVANSRNIHLSFNTFDWIRRNTPRKPYRYKINKIYSVLEEEKIAIDPDKDVFKNGPSEADIEVYNEVRKNVAESLAKNASRYFAVVHFAGKQFKVTNNDLISVKAPLIEAEPGELIRLEKILLAGNADFSIVGRPLLPRNNVLVTAMVVEKTLRHPSLWYQFHRRRRHRVMRVYQDNLVTLRIVDVAIKNV